MNCMYVETKDVMYRVAPKK